MIENKPLFDSNLLNTYIDRPMWGYLSNKFPDWSTEELEIRLSETIKFLYIASVIKGPLLVTEELDDIWHHMIMETGAYISLCKSLPGGQYIHHSSKDYQSGLQEEVPEDLEKEVVSYANYVYSFDGFNENTIQYWPGAQSLMNASDCETVEDFNNFLKEISVLNDVN